MRTHLRVAASVVAVGAIPGAVYVIDFSHDGLQADINAGSTLLQVWVAASLALLAFALVFDHQRPNDRFGPAALRLLPIGAGLALVAGWLANRGVSSEDTNFHLYLGAVLLATLAIGATKLRSYLSTPAPIREPKPPPTTSASHGTPKRHGEWANAIARLWLCAAPVIWFFTAWCTTDALRDTAVIALWALLISAGTFAAGRALDHRITTADGTLAEIGRVVAAAAVVFVLCLPLFALTAPALPDGCG